MKKIKKEQWLLARKFNREFCQSLDYLIPKFRLHFGTSRAIYIQVGGNCSVPTFTAINAYSSDSRLNYVSRYMSKWERYKEFFEDRTVLLKPLYNAEEKAWFFRETFLLSLRDHPFFQYNQFNPFIVFPRENKKSILH